MELEILNNALTGEVGLDEKIFLVEITVVKPDAGTTILFSTAMNT